MSKIRTLAGQTLWYGVSTVGARFLNYLLTPLLTYLLDSPSGIEDYGSYGLLYAWIAVANIIFSYGLETGFFRYVNKPNTNPKSVFQTTFGSIFISTIGLILLLVAFRSPIAQFISLGEHPEYIIWAALLVGLEALAIIPFAKLRQENHPRKYALIKIIGVCLNIFLVVCFLVFIPNYLETHSQVFFAEWYNRNNVVGFLVLANLIQNVLIFLLLFKEWKSFRFQIDWKLWKQIFRYSSPIIIIGTAAMINEVMDRQMLKMFLPMSEADAMRVVGVYNANYKLAILITLFIQAFKMAAEPFFFNQARDKNAPRTYAKVMKWFILTIACAFLITTLYLDVWKFFLGVPYRRGLGIVPILLGANICLGVYYNLSVWYKLTDKMLMGLYITLAGMAITLFGNYFFIPKYGMYAAAWATFCCYFLMMILSYLIGQKYYSVPYKVGRSALHIVAMLVVYFIYEGLHSLSSSLVVHLLLATGLMALFVGIIFYMEREELQALPVWSKLKGFIRR
ncbi:MAG TPA: oligosaccharide flippase family protein [Chitinophagaceae bacterium]|nr:oligosaccharide flippase family protein [Chitinophagaceae bacterium]